MTTIARLTRAEFRKLVAARTFLIGLAASVGLSVISVTVNAFAAGKNGLPALGTTAMTDKMLKLGVICCVAMLVLGIIASGSEYRHKTIVPAMLIAPRRGGLIIAKVIGIAVSGGSWWKWWADSSAMTVTRPRPKVRTLSTTPATAMPMTLAMIRPPRRGTASMAGMIVLCRYSLPEATMPSTSMATQQTEPSLSI